MSETTNVNETNMDPQHRFFDRQQRIAWWDQEKLFKARVLVVGAGALGNEVLKNLALLGVGHLLIVDFDTIEDSNLSRTVLFRSSDAADGASKALVAAERVRALNPNSRAVVRAIHGNVVWELGAGVYRHVDVVIGCLDNLEARLAVNLACWQVGTPWINGGMWELSGSVAVYDAASEKACFECSMAPDHYREAKRRYSCANETVKSRIRTGYEPTTQTTSAIVAALQSQEAVKLLHGLDSFPGRQLVFNGLPHFYTNRDYAPLSMVELSHNPDCLCHGEDRFEEIITLPGARADTTTARQLLAMIEAETGLTDLRVTLGRTFVIGTVCNRCDRQIDLKRPLYQVRDVDAVCPTCEVTCPTCGFVSAGQPDCPNCGQPDISELRLETFHTLAENEARTASFLDYTLSDLGIPALHILTVVDGGRHRINVELSGDILSLWSV